MGDRWINSFSLCPRLLQTVIPMTIGSASCLFSLGSPLPSTLPATSQRFKEICKINNCMPFVSQPLPPEMSVFHLIHCGLYQRLTNDYSWLVQFLLWYPSLCSFLYPSHILLVLPQEGLLEPLGMGLCGVSVIERSHPGPSGPAAALQRQGRRTLLWSSE